MTQLSIRLLYYPYAGPLQYLVIFGTLAAFPYPDFRPKDDTDFLLSIEQDYTLGLILVTNDAVSKTTKINKKVVKPPIIL